jgi:hypothetical protein
MTRRLLPHPSVSEVDALVLALDEATIDEPLTEPATSSYAVIVAAWDRFKALVEDLDVAVSAPLSKGAPRLFERAPELVNDDAHELAFWLAHVGEAVARGTSVADDPSVR